MRKNIRVQDRIVGEEIAYQRKLRDWTQSDLAYELAISPKPLVQGCRYQFYYTVIATG